MNRTAPIRVQHTWLLFRRSMDRRIRTLETGGRHPNASDRRLMRLFNSWQRSVGQHLRMKLAMRRDQNDGRWIQSQIDGWADGNDRRLMRMARVAGRVRR